MACTVSTIEPTAVVVVDGLYRPMLPPTEKAVYVVLPGNQGPTIVLIDVFEQYAVVVSCGEFARTCPPDVLFCCVDATNVINSNCTSGTTWSGTTFEVTVFVREVAPEYTRVAGFSKPVNAVC
jgi:hypothetical protein